MNQTSKSLRSRLGRTAIALLVSGTMAGSAVANDVKDYLDKLPTSGEFQLTMITDGKDDGFMRLGWKRSDDEFLFYDRSMMRSREVYETMKVSNDPATYQPKKIEIAFHVGTTIVDMNVKFEGLTASNSREVYNPTQGTNLTEFEKEVPDGTYARALTFLMPLVLPQEAGFKIEYPWYASLSPEPVGNVSLEAFEGGMVDVGDTQVDTIRYALRGGNIENDIYVSKGEKAEIVRVDVLGQPIHYMKN